MKNIAILLFFFIASISHAQEQNPTFEKVKDLVKATYYYEDGTIKEQGFFKDTKLTGTWVSYNKQGKKTMIGHYEAGKKVGKWFAWSPTSLKEISYANNVVVQVKNLEQESKLALNNK